jgi:hypothetical protein
MTPPNLPNTKPGGDDVMRGRLTKARDFLASAKALFTLGEEGGVLAPTSEHAASYIDLCVDAGIAASDAICISKTGRFSSGAAHQDAVAVLQAATDRATARHLGTLLAMKTGAAYGHRRATAQEIHNAGIAAAALVEYAENLIAGS